MTYEVSSTTCLVLALFFFFLGGVLRLWWVLGRVPQEEFVKFFAISEFVSKGSTVSVVAFGNAQVCGDGR